MDSPFWNVEHLNPEKACRKKNVSKSLMEPPVHDEKLSKLMQMNLEAIPMDSDTISKDHIWRD